MDVEVKIAEGDGGGEREGRLVSEGASFRVRIVMPINTTSRYLLHVC